MSVLDDIYKPIDDLEQTPAIIEGTRLQTRGGVFTDELIDSYIALKMEEVARWEMTPAPVEFDMYYSA